MKLIIFKKIKKEDKGNTKWPH